MTKSLLTTNDHMTTLSVIIPAYNEENGIEEIIHRVLAIRPALAEVGIGELELVVVDDCSADRTAELAASIDGVRLIQHEHNRGYGGALKTGFGNAQGELVGFLDADGTYPPEYFPKLCAAVLDGSELAVGSRRSGAESQMPPMRRLGNFFWSNLLSTLSTQRVNDPASGMRVFRRAVLDRIYPLPDGLNLTPVMSTRAVHEKIKMVEIPIPYSERVGNSKLSVVRDGSIFLHSIVWTALTYNPVRILGLVGLLGVAIAILVAIGLVVSRFSGNTSLSPWGVAAVFTALVSGVTGISIFSLGITFNYLVSLFYKRPVRQGLFGRPIFKTPLDKHFGWMGILTGALGLVIALISLGLGVQGWEISRLWLYLLVSAMFILVGAQLIIYWILLRVLGELSDREMLTQQELNI
ncbi:MAG: glycosyltransferase family 2 protein [Candidatus Promineifilaceae bacterium]